MLQPADATLIKEIESQPLADISNRPECAEAPRPVKRKIEEMGFCEESNEKKAKLPEVKLPATNPDLRTKLTYTERSKLSCHQKNVIYDNLGKFNDIDGLMSFYQKKATSMGKTINFIELFYQTDSPKLSCQVTADQVINIDQHDINIFFKTAVSYDLLEVFVVVGVHLNNIFDSEQSANIREKTESNVLPQMEKVIPKHAGKVSTWRSQSTEICHDGSFTCNGNRDQHWLKIGISKAFGCRCSAGHARNCHFYNIKDPELFPIPAVREIAEQLAKEAEAQLREFAPNAWFYMIKTPKQTHCRICGQAECAAYAGINILADYTAHAHRDNKDAKEGVSAILSFQKECQDGQTPSYHILPCYSLRNADKPGVAFNLGLGSVFFEAGRNELHGSTCGSAALDPMHPSRLAFVLFTHEALIANGKNHCQAKEKKAKSELNEGEEDEVTNIDAKELAKTPKATNKNAPTKNEGKEKKKELKLPTIIIASSQKKKGESKKPKLVDDVDGKFERALKAESAKAQARKRVQTK